MGVGAQLVELLDRLSEEDKAQVVTNVEQMVSRYKWLPQDGPQQDAYFSDADELLFGGAAGGGKSAFLVGYCINEGRNAVIFRNGLKAVNELENYAISVMGTRDGFSSQKHYFDLGQGRSLEFDSLEQPGSEQSWQGRRRDVVAFDEVTQQVKERVAFVMRWAGSAKPDARTRVIFATNPPLSDEGNWLITWFAPWVDPLYPNPAKPGELRWFVNNDEGDPVWVDGPGQHDRGDGEMSTAKSRTFVPSLLADNKYLRDTGYRAQIENSPEPLRSALLNGNFMAARKDDQYQVLPSDWLRAAQQRWKPENSRKPMLSLGVDVAGGGPDREVIAALHTGNHFAEPLMHQGVDTKDGFATAGRIITAQRNGAPIAIDVTGGWGGAAKTALKASEVDAIGIAFSETTGGSDPNSRLLYANLRAEMWWSFRLALDPKSGDDIALPPGARILAEGSSPRWQLKGGKIYIESKEDIRDRIGASPDVFDAMVMAWHIRARGVVKQMRKSPNSPIARNVPEANPFEVDGF